VAAEFSATFPNATLVALMLMAGAVVVPPVPVPVRETVCGLFDAPSRILTVAANPEAEVGLKLKLIVHEE
jgi:hypothetical protein